MPDLPRDREQEEVEIACPGATLHGILGVPAGAEGVVLFAHGSGSGRHSPRNNYVAGVLREHGLATLLLDLLTEGEEFDRRMVFDIDLLAARLAGATRWAAVNPKTQGLRPCYFGASTGAAAALQASVTVRSAGPAGPGIQIAAIVSRGGRPDLAPSSLDEVDTPTLLIVGGADIPVIPLNEGAVKRLRCEKRLAIVPGATHLFEEPGALEEVAHLAADWFVDHLKGARTR
ncbi:MAG: alpha/beta hydrolase [Actinomycetota bacterium]